MPPTKTPTERFARQTVSASTGEERWLECFYCLRPCAHEVLVRVVADWQLSDKAWYQDTNEVIQCGGCKKASYRNARMFFDDGSAEPLASEEDLYPRRGVKAVRSLVSGVMSVPLKPRTAYIEALFAFTRNHLLTSGTMIRAAVEYVCADQGLRRETLESKIDNLATAGLLSPVEAGLLHKLRFMGNRAVHSGDTPTNEDISAGFDIIEHLFRALYILPTTARTLPRKNRLKR